MPVPERRVRRRRLVRESDSQRLRAARNAVKVAIALVWCFICDAPHSGGAQLLWRPHHSICWGFVLLCGGPYVHNGSSTSARLYNLVLGALII
jgi:hypothetical protein